MLLLGERPSHVDQLTDRIKKLANKLFESLPEGKQVNLSHTTDLYAFESTENLYIIQKGNISGYRDNQLCVYYEDSDLIGLTDCYQLPSLKIVVEDTVEAIQYSADTLLRYVNETKERQAIWTSYLITQIALFQDSFSRSQLHSSQPLTGFLNFEAGQTIINQGDDAHEVFTILSGSAEVFVDNTKVGDILADEIFGAMAVFTDEKRSATVKAAESVTILAVPKEEFITLIQSHPQTTMTLIDNMARRIKTLNSQITRSEKP